MFELNMTITHSSTRLVASVAGVAVAAALIAGAFAVQPAKAALSSSQVSAIITLLQSFGADSTTIANVQASLTGGTPSGSTGGSTSGGAGACYTWTRDLQSGSTGADVTALQVFLNSNSATMVAASGAGSAGMETMTFGPATKAAVMKFQTANGISPAAGYFGPVTRAAVAAKCSGGGSTPSTPSGPLKGGEGELQINDTLGDVESSVDEGDNDTKVLGVEVEAKDSDVSINRVDVDFTLSGTGSTRLTNYIDSVTLWLDGKKLATMDAGDVDKDSGDVYSFRFSGLNGVVREDDQANLYVSVDAVSNIDSGDSAKNIAVEIPENGIRAVDGAGISDTYVDSGDNLTETFTVGESSGGNLEIKEGDTNPNGQVVSVDEDDDTNGVQV
ncbi:peptidoglycan-binding protein, partial [Candidatus Parcubacteria bacterium]|nr:peptidoglycan-binding protein [Candidatus Parcubacteria bacterium]